MYTAMDEDELRRATVHELIDWQVSDLIAETRKQLQERPPANHAAIATAEPYVTMSGELCGYKLELERFLRARVYRHPDLLATRKEYQTKLQELFDLLCDRPAHLPNSFTARIEAEGLERTIGDYIAGMTDRFAMQEWQRFHTEFTIPPACEICQED